MARFFCLKNLNDVLLLNSLHSSVYGTRTCNRTFPASVNNQMSDYTFGYRFQILSVYRTFTFTVCQLSLYTMFIFSNRYFIIYSRRKFKSTVHKYSYQKEAHQYRE